MSAEDPTWRSGDPQHWGRYWRAGYTLDGAKPVTVEQYARSEKVAQRVADEALIEAMEKVRDLGLRVSGKAWTVQHQTRDQHRQWEPVVVQEYEVQPWPVNLKVTLKGLTL